MIGSTRSQKSETKQTGRADVGSFAGLLVAAVCIVAALLLEGGKLADISQGTAALIVFGGTLGAVLLTTPFGVFLSSLRRSAQVFTVRSQPFAHTLNQLLKFADGARKAGLASLEDYASAVEDPFFIKALNLAADGTEVTQFREMMLLDLDCEQERAESEIRVWENAAGYAPTIGIIGAVLGLIQVMKHLENLDEVGRGIAVSFVATVYGVAAANLFLLPIAGKIRSRCRDAERLHEMMLEGVLAIAEGTNPTLIRIKLAPFLGAGSEPHRIFPIRTRAVEIPVKRGHLVSQ